MTIATQTFIDTLVIEHCCSCGMPFGMSRDFYNRHLNGDSVGKWFYCPAGHQQYYNGESWQTKAKKAEERAARIKAEAQESVASARRDAELARQHRDAAIKARESETTKRKNIQKHVAAGVCPCCQRTFKQLAAHMKGQHPEYAPHDR